MKRFGLEYLGISLSMVSNEHFIKQVVLISFVRLFLDFQIFLELFALQEDAESRKMRKLSSSVFSMSRFFNARLLEAEAKKSMSQR